MNQSTNRKGELLYYNFFGLCQIPRVDVVNLWNFPGNRIVFVIPGGPVDHTRVYTTKMIQNEEWSR